MTEAVFPLLGPALVVVLVLPAAALIARLLVVVGRATRMSSLEGLGSRYVLLVASSLLPLAWFASAAIHQAESGRSVIACVVDHGPDSGCLEPRLFSAALLAAMLVLALPTLAQRLRGRRRESLACEHEQEHERVVGIVERTPRLAELRGRFRVTREAGPAIATWGLLRPIVVIEASYLAGLDDVAIAAALGHELEHVRHRDPLRYLFLSLALQLNPLGRRWLAPEVGRWRSAREVQCDHDAVARGADPAALAHALVRAARPAADAAAPALADGDLAVLQLRVELLLAYAESPRSSRAPVSRPMLRFAGALLALVVAWPHSGETAALDVLHASAEYAVATILW